MSDFGPDLQVVYVEDVYGVIYAYELRDDEDEEVALIRCKTEDGMGELAPPAQSGGTSRAPSSALVKRSGI